MRSRTRAARGGARAAEAGQRPTVTVLDSRRQEESARKPSQGRVPAAAHPDLHPLLYHTILDQYSMRYKVWRFICNYSSLSGIFQASTFVVSDTNK